MYVLIAKNTKLNIKRCEMDFYKVGDIDTVTQWIEYDYL